MNHELATVLQAQRDAALAAIERVRALHKLGWQQEPYGNGPDGQVLEHAVSWCLHCDMASPCDTLAALDVAPEPEWEYGSGPEDALDQSGLHTSRATAERGVVEWNEFTQRSERMGGRPLERLVLVRRRKAGPWESVGGETDG